MKLHVLLRHRLLLQAHGFEGFGVIEEELFENDATLADRADDGVALLAREAALRPLHVPAQPKKDTVAQVDYALDPEVRPSRRRGLPVEVDGGLTTVGALLGPSGVHPQGDVRVGDLLESLPVSAPEGVGSAPDQLHVLLRHHLLLQPHGFEGFGGACVRLPPDDAALLDLEHVRGVVADGGSRALPDVSRATQDHDVVTRRSAFSALKANVLPVLVDTAPCPPYSVESSIASALKVVSRQHELDARMEAGHEGFHVSLR